MNLLVKMKFGSHLYGTETPDSDRDFKGVFLPSKQEVYLGKIAKSVTLSKGHDQRKNTKEDMDYEVYSLHYFLKLACEGQTVALDMLHAGERHLLHTSSIWRELMVRREWFYTSNLSVFVGYARTQAAKYGIKGSRLAAAKEASEFLRAHGKTRVSDIWNLLWENEYCYFLDNGIHRIWQVCGKGVSETSNCELAAEMLAAFVERYGDRAKKAERNEGIDWKAISHALRAGYQARAIFVDGGFNFPIQEVNFLRAVKSGALDYMKIVAPALEGLMTELEALKLASDLPERIDQGKIDHWLMEVLDGEYQ
ncbi:MAG: nucleotidyltransferase domain-containing protein [Nitrospirales bacterium]|nr:nucleotidyltransferase domain-containing protein [Nitrospirales bacterium]